MGTTLREIIYDIGGGIRNGKEFKAVQTGGPSGGCIPRAVPRHARSTTRSLTQARLDHGLRRHDRHGRGQLHGRRRQVLPGVHARTSRCGKCTPCRDGHQAHAGDPGRASPRARASTATSRSSNDLGTARSRRLASAASARRRPTRCSSTIKLLPRGVRGAHQRQEVPGRKAARCLVVVRHRRQVHRLRSARRALPVHIAGSPKPAEIDQAACIRCGVCFETCKFEASQRFDRMFDL